MWKNIFFVKISPKTISDICSQWPLTSWPEKLLCQLLLTTRCLHGCVYIKQHISTVPCWHDQLNGTPLSPSYLNIYTPGHFTFWISPSLSAIAEWNRCNSQASRSNYRGYLHVLKIFIIIIIDNKILNFLDCTPIGMSSIFTGVKMKDTSKDGTLLTCLLSVKYCLEYLTAVTYYCQVEVEVRDWIAVVDTILLPISCSDIISKQYGGRQGNSFANV